MQTTAMQTKEFDELFSGLAALSTTDRMTGYIERCNKMTPKQKAKVLVTLFDDSSRAALLQRLFSERRYAQAGIVCIYQNAIEDMEEQLTLLQDR